MSSYITMDDILRHKDVYAVLKKYFGDAVPPPLFSEKSDNVTEPPPCSGDAKNKVPAVNSAKLPPVYITENGQNWKFIRNWCKERSIKYKFVQSLREGIKVTFNTLLDYNAFITLLKENNVPFYTGEQQYHVIIRNIPKDLTCQHIEEFLLEQKFTVYSVNQMSRNCDEIRTDIVLVVIDRDSHNKSILILQTICNAQNISVRMANRFDQTQCEQCKIFGHSYVDSEEEDVTVEAEYTKLPNANKSINNGQTDTSSRDHKSSRHSKQDSIIPDVSTDLGSRSQYIEQNKIKSEPINSTECDTGSTVKESQSNDTIASTKLKSMVEDPKAALVSDSIAKDFRLLTRFLEETNFKETLELSQLLRKNQGDPLAMLQLGMRIAGVMEKMSAFRINPEDM